jgi:hypothetical protein
MSRRTVLTLLFSALLSAALGAALGYSAGRRQAAQAKHIGPADYAPERRPVAAPVVG